MRILHVIPRLDPADGGPPKIALRLAAGQASAGNDVHMLAYSQPQIQPTIDGELRSVPGADKLKLHWLSPPDAMEERFALRARKEVDNLMGSFDFAHFHALWSPLTKAGANAAWRHRVPYAILLNGMLDPWSLSQKRLKKQVALALGYRRILNRATFLHTGNAEEVRLIEPLGLTSPCRTIPNGIFIEELSPLPAEGTFHARHPELAGQRFILFLARLHFKKGLDYLADAFASVAKQVADVRLVVAGPDDGAKDDFTARIASAGIADRVHIVGPIYGEDRLAALRDATLFCLPSRQEGFSLAITEALGCGVPAVISDACHFPEVADAGAGFVLPLDPKAFADAMVKILNDPSLRQRMSEAGRELIHRKYTWPAIAAETIRVYNEFRT